MKSKNLDLYLENESLKNEFAMRNLDLSQVWEPSPEDPELENRQLRDLLDWVIAFKEFGGNRKKMEKAGYHFPPLSFDIDPDEDWLRFRRWMAGQKIRGKLKSRLPPDFIVKPADHLTEEQIIPELERLQNELERLHFSVELKEALPPRLLYEDLLELLDEEFDFMMTGCWHLDSCSGYCPDCFQRPWCEFGTSSCWQEDEAAGYMVFPEVVKKYVSPSPVSLEILRSYQANENEQLDKWNKSQELPF
jgi:hypothetical protein